MQNPNTSNNIQRHFSDTAYLPTKSSRLNPNSDVNPNLTLNTNAMANGNLKTGRGLPIGILQQRGTMSMPTSPLMSKMVVQGGANPHLHVQPEVSGDSQSVWDSPHTAQAFFSIQDQQSNPTANSIPPNQTKLGVQSPTAQQPLVITHVSPYDIAPPSAIVPGYYDLNQPPGTTSMGYISPQSSAFKFPDSSMSMEVDSESPMNSDHLGLPFQTQSSMMNNTFLVGDTLSQANHIGAQDRRRQSDGDVDMNMNMNMNMDLDVDMDGDTGPGGRKKRIQVRIACTHCQKACKKCSNTRPCERCVKYGLSDCVDSTRKPRKTGIKRGPYKRRSSKYSISGNPHLNYTPQIKNLPAPTNPTDSNDIMNQQQQKNAMNQVRPPYFVPNGYTHPHPHPHLHTHTPHARSNSNANPNLHDHLIKTNHTKANFSHLQVPKSHSIQNTALSPILRASSDDTNNQKKILSLPGTVSTSNSTLEGNIVPQPAQDRDITYPPFPKSTDQIALNPLTIPDANSNVTSNPNPNSSSLNLITALSNAFSVSQTHWVNGQRLPIHPDPASSSSSTPNLAPPQLNIPEEGGGGKGKTTPLYPKTPIGPFPFSLFGNANGKDDPFSRAVSPIKQFEFGKIASKPLASENGLGVGAGTGRAGLDGVREESESAVSVENVTSPVLGVVGKSNEGQGQGQGQIPGHNQVKIDMNGGEITPPTINISETKTNPTNLVVNNQSTVPPSQAGQTPISNSQTLTINTQPLSNTSNIGIQSPQPTPGLGHTPFILPTKIRKPSLRTLMSTTSSRAPSPSPSSSLPPTATLNQGQPQGQGFSGGIISRNEIQSPTLFNDDDGKSISGMLDEINSFSNTNTNLNLGLGLDGERWGSNSSSVQISPTRSESQVQSMDDTRSNEMDIQYHQNQTPGQQQNHNLDEHHIDSVTFESLMGIQ